MCYYDIIIAKFPFTKPPFVNSRVVVVVAVVVVVVVVVGSR